MKILNISLDIIKFNIQPVGFCITYLQGVDSLF